MSEVRSPKFGLFRRCVGIDIKGDFVLMVYLYRGVSGIFLRDSTCFSLPTSDGDLRLKALVEGVLDFLERNRARDVPVVLAIPREGAFVRRVQLPLTVEENLRKVFEYELERLTPFSTETCYFDYQVLQRDEEAKLLHALLVVMRSKVFHTYWDALTEAGITPVAVELDSTGMANFLALGPMKGDPEPYLLIDPWENGFQVSLVERGRLLYSRYIVHEEDSSLAKRVVDECELSLYYRPSVGRAKVIILGLGLPEDVKGRLRRRFLLLDGGSPSRATLRWLRGRTKGLDLRYISALGLALRGLKRPVMEINLIPGPLRPRIRGFRVAWLGWSVILALIIMAIFWVSRGFIESRKELVSLNKELEELAAEVKRVEGLETKVKALKQRVDFYEGLIKEDYSKLELLKALTVAIPTDSWLRHLNISGQRVTMEGMSPSSSGLITLLYKTQAFTKVDFVAPVTRSPDGTERFKLRGMVRLDGKGSLRKVREAKEGDVVKKVFKGGRKRSKRSPHKRLRPPKRRRAVVDEG